MFLCNSWSEKRKRKRRQKMLQWSQNGSSNPQMPTCTDPQGSASLSFSLPNLQEQSQTNGAAITAPLDASPLLHSATDSGVGTLASSPSPEATAFLIHVHLKHGRNLAAMDITGSSDPYVTFKYKHTLLYKSETVFQSLNPTWDEQFVELIDNRSVPLNIEAYDYDRFSMDDFIGTATIDLSALPLETSTDLNIPLVDREIYEEAGRLSLTISLKPVSGLQASQMKEQFSSNTRRKVQISYKRRTAFRTDWLKDHIYCSALARDRRNERTCVIHVVLVEAKDLRPVFLGRSVPLPNPFVRMKLGDERVKSRAASKTLNPKWMQAFVFHPRSQTECLLELQVFDKSRDSLLGTCTIDLSALKQEKSHHTWYDLEGDAGKVLLVITISGLARCDVSDLASYDANPLDVEALRQKYSLKKTLSNKSVGFLIVKVFKADALASFDVGGKSDPFCVVELVNSRLQTNTIHRTLSPEWNKVFTFDVTDINALLELTVYDEDPNKKTEFMGKVALPLLRIKNNEKRWYALKDEKMLKRAKGRILLEATLFWNPVRASFRTFTPKELKYTAQKGRFQRRVFMRNMDRIKKYGNRLVKFHQFVQSCFSWRSPPRSFAAFLIFVLAVYFFELYMLPLALAITLLLAYLTISIAQDDDDDDKHSDEYVRSDSESEEDEVDKAARNASLAARLDAVQAALLDVQTSLEFAVSITQRIRNTFNFTQPFCSYTAIFVITTSAVILFFVPVRWLILAWGINKFTKKFRKPRGHIASNELLNFLLRVPCDKEIRMYGEFYLKEAPQVQHTSMNGQAP